MLKKYVKHLSENALGPEKIESHFYTVYYVCCKCGMSLNPSRLVFHVSLTALFVYSSFLQDICSGCDTENVNKVNLESGE